MKKIIILVAIASLISVSFQQKQNKSGTYKATVYLTARDTKDRLTQKDAPAFGELAQPDEDFPTIMVDPDKKFQVMEGFGGALTDASAETFYKLPESRQQEILDAYFSPEKGIGYSLCRTHINSCDFSSSSYSYDDTPGDTLLTKFSIDPDRKYRIPLIKAALERSKNNLKIFASPWSPPAWMKTNNDMLHGGKLRPEYARAWAGYYVKFIEEYGKAGIPIWGLTVQNEPMATQRWESCIYTGEEERDFIKNHLGPVLVKNLQKVKLIIWDHNRGIMYQRAKAVLDDPAASRYVWGTGFHWYIGDHFDNVRLVHDSWPDKKLVFTEGTPASYDQKILNEWRWGEQYGEAILMDVNNWASGWVDWNILVDEKGGPNHVGNFCIAPVIGNTKTGEVIYMNSFYYVGHFSKFVVPGARRIVASSNNDRLLSTAFINPDGKIVVVVMNQSERGMDFKTWIDGKVLQTNSPGHSIITIVIG